MNGFIFFLKSVFVFFPVSVSVRIHVPHTRGSSSSYPCVSLRQHNKTYSIVSKRTEQRWLILTSGQTHVCPRPPASAPPLRKFSGWFLVGHHQAQFLRRGLAGANPPPIHPKTTRQRHDQLFLAPTQRLGIKDLCPPLLTQPIFRLIFQ